ncbi:MAG TPA: hypothetical protein VGE41_00950 [Verrucomicrobiae bacterium]|jgi:hypothetical protein
MKFFEFVRKPQGWFGLILIGIFWPLNWCLPGTRTAYLFFPLWLGYILVMDALVLTRRGDSLLSRSPLQFVLLFVLSAPAWWLFEWINSRTHNWKYMGGNQFTGLEYFILSSVSFSTVMPSVFESAEFMRSLPVMQRLEKGPHVSARPWMRLSCLAVGAIMFWLTWRWPRTCYPFVWTSLVLILEGINGLLRRPCFLDYLHQGDWRPVVALALGALLCGFFWEMWNYYSFPKWVYDTPGVKDPCLFEMPLLGYLGYIPFAWELYGLRNLLWPWRQHLKL